MPCAQGIGQIRIRCDKCGQRRTEYVYRLVQRLAQTNTQHRQSHQQRVQGDMRQCRQGAYQRRADREIVPAAEPQAHCHAQAEQSEDEQAEVAVTFQ